MLLRVRTLAVSFLVTNVVINIISYLARLQCSDALESPYLSSNIPGHQCRINLLVLVSVVAMVVLNITAEWRTEPEREQENLSRDFD